MDSGFKQRFTEAVEKEIARFEDQSHTTVLWYRLILEKVKEHGLHS